MGSILIKPLGNAHGRQNEKRVLIRRRQVYDMNSQPNRVFDIFDADRQPQRAVDGQSVCGERNIYKKWLTEN